MKHKPYQSESTLPESGGEFSHDASLLNYHTDSYLHYLHFDDIVPTALACSRHKNYSLVHQTAEILYGLMKFKLKGSVEEGRKYLFRCDFFSCSESTEIWHASSFAVKKCPCFF